MRILIVHSRYLSGDASGENRVVEDEARLLREGGHDVRVWSPSPSDAGGLKLLKTGFEAVWSAAARAHIRDVIAEQQTDIVHAHNIFPSVSPAALRLSADGPALVVTLHNYRLMCLPGTFLRDGRICEDCLGRIPVPGVVHRCYRDSLGGSAAMATSIALHRDGLKTFDRVNLFLALSEFMRDKYVQGGWQRERIAVKSNFAWESPQRRGPGDYFLYLGRLSEEKGLSMLVPTWDEVDAPLVIAGHGPEEARLRAIAGRNVDFRGLVPGGDVPELLRRARAVLLPSKSYEGGPRVLLEAYAAGVPVLASDIGGVGQSVADGQSGVLLPHNQPRAWIEAAAKIMDDAESARLGAGARALWKERYSPTIGLADLERAYLTAQSNLQRGR